MLAKCCRTAWIVCLAASFAVAEDSLPKPKLPDGLKGFAGELAGKLARKYDTGFTLDVADVVNVWKHSTAKEPDSAVGRTLVINLRWEPNGEGGWRMSPQQVAWLREVAKEGEAVRVDVANKEGERLHLMDLNEEQRKALKGDKEKDKEAKKGKIEDPGIPDGMKGFSGTLEGTVVRVAERMFLLHVTEVVNTWKANKAEAPESVVDRDVLICAQWKKGDDDKWHPVEAHVRWIRTLSEGDECQIEVVNDEGERLHILELGKEQREAGDDK